MKFKVNDKIFASSAEAYEFCIAHNISVEEIEEIQEDTEERGVIHDSEENLSEAQEGVPNYEDLTPEERAKYIVDNWNKIDDETLKQMFISYLASKTVKHEIPLPEKNYEGNIKVEDSLEDHVSRIADQLTRKDSIVCPFCSKEVLGLSKDNVKAKILHAREFHREQLTAYAKMIGTQLENNPFAIVEPEREYSPTAKRDDSESCSKMSKENLVSEILNSSELRRKYIEKWIKEQKRSK